MQEWANLITTVGFPIALILLIAYAIWKICWKLADWWAPRIDRIIEAHLKTLESLNENLAKVSESITDHDERVSEQHFQILQTQKMIVSTQERIIQHLNGKDAAS